MKKTHTLHRFLSLVLCICMVLSMVPGYALPALAEGSYPYAVEDTETGIITIDGTLGGKTEATEADMEELASFLESSINNGKTSFIVTGENQAIYAYTAEKRYPVVGFAIAEMPYDHNGTIDVIYRDATELLKEELAVCCSLRTVALPNVSNCGDDAFSGCYYLENLEFGSVVTSVGEDAFHDVDRKVDGGCELVLNCGQMQTESYKPNLDTSEWAGHTWKSITLTHTPEADDGDCTTAVKCTTCGETVVEAKESHTTELDENKATCQNKAKCDLCGTEYGDPDPDAHSFNSADGKCSVCQNFIAEASVTIDGNITYYATINEAIVAVEDCTDDDNAVVKMEQSIDLGTTWLEVFGGVFTFDLNGKTLSSTDNSWGTFSLTDYTESRNIHVTITDSGDGGTITHGTFMGISSWGCTLTIEGGTIIGDYCGVAIESSSVVTINGGTISGNEHGVDAVSGSTVTINGGTITGTEYDLYNVDGTFTLGLGENGIGATFPDGLAMVDSDGFGNQKPGGFTLKDILGEGAAYWQDDKMLTVADDATSIDGDVTVKAECKHENATYSEITDTQHKITCSCGYEVTEEHTPDENYTANGNVISVSCSKCQGIAGTVTITAEDTTYDGNAQETATVAYSEGWNSGELTVSYVNNVNAGTATASITIGEATASVEFTIAKAEIDGSTLINPEFAEGLIYNGTAQALVTKTGSVDGGYIVYSLSIDGEYTTTIPVATEAGNYRVYWTIECDENHYVDGTPGSSRVTIAKANPEYTVPTGLTATYGDTLANVELPTGWAWKDAETTSVGNAGTRTFKALYNPDSNNYNTVEADVTVEVAKANPEYTVPTGLTATYGDTLAKVELPVGWTWKDAESTSVGNAGTSTFKALYNPDSNNYNTVEADVTIEVAKALIDIYTDNLINPEFAEGLIYNGTAQALVTNSGSIDGGYIVFSLNPDGEYTTEIPVATEAGEYVVFYRIEGDENHYWEGSSAFDTVTIAKADSSVTTTPAVQELIYNGEIYALVIPGEAKGGTMVYSDLEDGTYGSIPEASAPGIYTVWYKVQGDSNHNDTDPQSLTVTITCDHSFNTNNISGNGDGKHSYICSVCKVEVVEDHAGVTAVFEWPDSYSDYMEVYADLVCSTCGEEVDYFWVYGDAIMVETLPGTDCKNPTVATCTLNYEYNGVTYTDTKTYIVPGDPHAGEFVNGFCSACGGFEEAVWNEEDYVYEIYNAGQLYWYAQELNTNNSEIYVKLMKDIVIPENAPNWTPINASYAYFDGNFKTISGLKCIDTDAQYVGLFGNEGWWYEISNLHIADSYFEGGQNVAAVVASLGNGGSVTNCYVTNTTVKGDENGDVGALVGYLAAGTVANCYTDSGIPVGFYYNGYGTIENCYYLSEEETEDGGKTAAQFASGEVAFLLQSGIVGEDIYDDDWNVIDTIIPQIWGQTIGSQKYPVFGGQKVYEVTNCKGETAYSNTEENGAHTEQTVTGKAPTCTETGLTDGVICSVCGETLTTQEEIPVLSHSYEDDVCTVCGHIGVPVKLDSASLSFKEKIHYNIFFSLGLDETVDLSDMGLVMFDSLKADGTMDDAIAIYAGAVEIDGKYMVATDGVPAKYMGDTIYFRAYAKLADGSYVYSKTVEYSAVTYAEHILNSDKPESAKALVVAMLNYGAAAQMFFGYNTDNLVNTFLTDEQKALPEQYRDDMANTVPVVAAEKQGIFANNKGFSKRAPAVSFEGAFEINYFFTPAHAPVDGITLYYWTEADFEANEILTVDNATGSLKLEGTGTEQYRGDIGGIAAKNLSENIYVAAVYSDGTTTWTSGVLGYSIGAYCGRLATNGGTIADLAMATAVYGYHAKAYFG